MEDDEIITALRAAYDAFCCCDFKKFRKILEDTDSALEKYPADSPLRGEWIMIRSLSYFSEPDKLIGHFKTALLLIGGRSVVLVNKPSMCLDFYNIFSIYYRPGRADEIAEQLEEAATLFEMLTGCGKEIPLCYRAQLAHYRGESEKALPLAEKAYTVARANGNYLVALCAADLVGNLAKHSGDDKLWNKMHFYIDGVIHDNERRKVCIETAENLRAEANMHLGVFKDIPEYIKTGDFSVIPQKSNSLGFAVIGEKISPTLLYYEGIIRIQYLFYTKKYIDAINTGAMLRSAWNASLYPFGDAYLDLLLASNYCMLGDMESSRMLADSAMERIAADRLWLIPSEFVFTSLGSCIIETAEKYAPEAGNIVRDLGINYWNKLNDLHGIIHRESLISALNDREYEVALLAADRLSNAEIAKQLFISESTVKFHISNIFGKLGIKKRAEISSALEKSFSDHFSLLKSGKRR